MAEYLQKRFYLEPSPLEFVRTGVEPPRSWLCRHILSYRTAKSWAESGMID